MTQIHLTFWREEHVKDERNPNLTHITIKPFSDRIANFTLVEAKNESELSAEIARALDHCKTDLARLAVEEYGAQGYVKPSLSVLRGSRKFANFDAIARKLTTHYRFNASQHLDAVDEADGKAGA